MYLRPMGDLGQLLFMVSLAWDQAQTPGWTSNPPQRHSSCEAGVQPLNGNGVEELALVMPVYTLSHLFPIWCSACRSGTVGTKIPSKEPCNTAMWSLILLERNGKQSNFPFFFPFSICDGFAAGIVTMYHSVCVPWCCHCSWLLWKATPTFCVWNFFKWLAPVLVVICFGKVHSFQIFPVYQLLFCQKIEMSYFHIPHRCSLSAFL